ncbi:unnamed protein product [Arabidopsis halleri]
MVGSKSRITHTKMSDDDVEHNRGNESENASESEEQIVEAVRRRKKKKK